ncbi:T9SS type A sorting domain-containing protein [candidate division WOR-3 bacterium]|nr:T9SS type A sorting domain-containing protein [candidate division WOR-3 bacterium]
MDRTFKVLFLMLLTVPVMNPIAAFGTSEVMKMEVNSEGNNGLELSFSLGFYEIRDFETGGKIFQEIIASGIVLPNEPGKPYFPTYSEVFAVPSGAEIVLNVNNEITRTVEDVLPVPSFIIPADNDNSPISYVPDQSIYEGNMPYPDQNVFVSQRWKIRGVDLITVTVIPFSWNPVLRKLTVYENIDFSISFVGGSGRIGEERLRTRNWDRVLKSIVANYNSLPKIDYSKRIEEALGDSRDNAEFLIIVPDDSIFISWAESIKDFRVEEGIITEVFTLTEIGGSTSTIIESFINDAFYNWTIAPEAVLILSDYPNSGDGYGVVAPIYNGYCASDNIYADIDGDNLPDLAIGRICAQNEDHLRDMITKDLNLERNPNTEMQFYKNPISACGWQYERWFQLCAEVIRGFWANSLGKDPLRVYAIYQSPNPAPGMQWSSAANTQTVVNYFNALGYIDLTVPSTITWNGTAQDVIVGLNSGAFMLQHRDHGSESGWGQPDFSVGSINQLQNYDTKYPYVMSTNCLTGKYNSSGQVFAERFHRITDRGAVGVNAASEVSYSFVNDVYAWGIYDYMWPWFDPNHGVGGQADVRPGWATMSAKYYLFSSSWCGSTSKPVTYHLMHHFGDPYMRLFSEEPQHLSAIYPEAILEGVDSFRVWAPESSIVAFSQGGEVIGRGEGDGSWQYYDIEPQNAGDTVKVAVIKQNYYRNVGHLPVVPASLPYIVYSHISDTSGGHGDGQINPGQAYSLTVQVANWGGANAQNVFGHLSSSDPNVSIAMDTVSYGTINSMDTTNTNETLGLQISNGVQDSTTVNFDIICRDSQDSAWTSQISLLVNSPRLEVSDISGPVSLNPGDDFKFSAALQNLGSGTAHGIEFKCRIADPYITVMDSTESLDSLSSQQEAVFDSAFRVIIDPSCPQGHFTDMIFVSTSGGGMTFSDTFRFGVGVSFVEDFETGGTNWTYTGPSSWHVTEHRYHGGQKSMYCGNENTWVYSNSVANARVISPDLDYTNNSVLSFWHYYDMANNYDKVQLQYSIDGGTSWNLINPEEGYTGAWGYTPYDSIYTGSQTVWEEQHVRFHGNGTLKFAWLFFSNPTLSAEGYYFDDVSLTLGSGFVGVDEEEELTGGAGEFIFGLKRVFPNPMKNRAMISFSIGEEVNTSIIVYDVSGRTVRTLVEAVLRPGNYRTEWDGRDDNGTFVGSGTYFYRMTAGSFSAGDKLILIR